MTRTVAATHALAAYACSVKAADLPAPVVHEARRAMVNWAGCAVGASAHPTTENAWRALRAYAGREQATLLGRAERTDGLTAALINGIASHVLDFDDTHPDVFVHPSGPVASALLALAEERHAPGEEFLAAFVAGVEVECRIARAVMPAHYEIGWHLTGTAGIFGAAAACARLLRLDERRTAWALGLAATQASGLREMFGSMAKSFHPGGAARNGLASALMAAEGFTAAESAIEGKRGFAHVLSTTVELAQCTDGLGRRYELLRNTYKPYACGLVIHPSIDAGVRLRAGGLVPADLERLELVVHPMVMELTAKTTPRTGLEGKFSVFHATAAALIDGAGGEAQFSDARVNDPVVVALRGRIHARADASIPLEGVRATAHLRDGKRREMSIDHCLGSIERPMSDAQLDEKYRAQCEPVLGKARSEAALAALWNFDGLPDVAACARAAGQA